MKLTLVSIIFLGLISGKTYSQTTAVDFQGVDCNGNNVQLFDDLDAGQAVVLFFYMPNCGSCPPPAQKIQTMANNINASCPGMVKGYAYPFQNSTTCSYSQSWVTSNNLQWYTPMDSGAYQVAYYGGFGMPTVVLLGGANHDVLWSTQNFVTSDTTVMRDLILAMDCLAGIEENNQDVSNLEIHPNPSNEIVNFSFDVENNASTQVELTDLLGKTILVKKELIVQDGKVEASIDLRNIPNGNYFLQIRTNSGIATKKIVVSH